MKDNIKVLKEILTDYINVLEDNPNINDKGFNDIVKGLLCDVDEVQIFYKEGRLRELISPK